MIKDAINSFRLTLDDRVGNPFVSAFLLSSVFVNWKLTLLLTSGLGYEEKLEKVDVLYQGYGSGLTGFVIVPFFLLVSGLLYGRK